MPEVPSSPQRASEALQQQGDDSSVTFRERGSRQRDCAYGPYGQLPPQRAVGGLRFTGQWFDDAVQGYLLGNGHRPYSPRIMRLLSPDGLSPFGAGGINAYAYCSDDPVNFHDPSGRYKTGLTKVLQNLGLPKQPLRDYLKPLGRLENFRQKRWVYRLEGDTFKTFEFTGAGKKVIGAPSADRSAFGEYVNSASFYQSDDLFIPQQGLRPEAAAALESSGFRAIRFDLDTFVAMVVPSQASVPAGGHSALRARDNLYTEEPTSAATRIRTTRPN